MFLLQVFLFYLLFVPFWYASANATRRYARYENRPEKRYLRDEPAIDSANVDIRHFAWLQMISRLESKKFMHISLIAQMALLSLVLISS